MAPETVAKKITGSRAIPAKAFCASAPPRITAQLPKLNVIEAKKAVAAPLRVLFSLRLRSDHKTAVDITAVRHEGIANKLRHSGESCIPCGGTEWMKLRNADS